MTQQESYHQKMQTLKCAVLIPTYNNAPKLGQVLDSVLAFTDQLIVVNDGSTDQTGQILEQYPGLEIVSYADNVGKGWALRKGFEKARDLGYEYVITLDSDGQHKADDIPGFIDVVEKHPGALIVGSRNMSQDGVPGTSNFGHRFSNFWYKLETGVDLPDTQSGYRLYPLKKLESLKFYTTKYELELEVLVRAAWNGIEVIPIPINVVYPEDRISHFRMFMDFARISVLNSIFVLWTFLYVKPAQFFSNFKKENRKAFIRKHVLMTTESNGKIVLASMLGVFLGVAPIWGYQIIAGLALAHLFRLSKVLVVATSHISIPPMIPLIIFSSFKLGSVLLGTKSAVFYQADLSLNAIKNDLLQYVVGSLALGIGLAICTGFVLSILLILFRKKPVVTD